MARPPKNNCDYFPHDSGMRDHPKVKALRSKFGITGYALWSMLIEFLTSCDGNVFKYSDMQVELLAGDFGVSATEIRGVLDYCITLELLFNRDGFINSDSLDERLAPVYEKRGKAKELSAQQRRENGKFATNNTEGTVVTVTEIPQSKVKESKSEESKVNDSDAGKPATIEQRASDFMDKVAQHLNGYSKEMLRDFYDYWTEKNEGGRKMRFEMQKVFDIERRLKTWDSNEKKNGSFKNKRSEHLNGLKTDFAKRASESN